MDLDEMESKYKIIIAVVCVAVAVIAFSWTYREELNPSEEKQIEPMNVTPAGETKKEVQLSSHEVLIENDGFTPKEIEINLEEAGENQVSKGQIKFINNGSQDKSVTIQRKEGDIVSTFTVPPGSSRRHPFFPGDEGEYVFSVPHFNSTGTVTVS